MIARIVVATEDKEVQEDILNYVSENDYQFVFEKLNPCVILQLIENPCDLLLIDIDSDHEQGVQIISIIRQTHPLLPIVVLCSCDSSDPIKRIVELGILCRTMKPVQKEEIKGILESIERIQAKRMSTESLEVSPLT